MNKREIEYFNSYVANMAELKNQLLYVSDEFHFTINEIDVDMSGCHQCKCEYPTVSISGDIFLAIDNYRLPQRYVANMSTYDFFNCRCRDYLIDTVPEMFFKFYINENYDKWINAVISDNIKKVNS